MFLVFLKLIFRNLLHLFTSFCILDCDLKLLFTWQVDTCREYVHGILQSLPIKKIFLYACVYVVSTLLNDFCELIKSSM